MRKTILLISSFLLIINHLSAQDELPLSGRALLLTLDGYIGSAGPYPSGGGSILARYEFRSEKNGEFSIFPSIGAGLLGIGYGGGIAFPAELNIALEYKYIGLFTSLGGTVITELEGSLLHPAILPSLRGVTRFKMPRSRMFIDMEYRLFGHYTYRGSGYYGGYYSPPFTRDGWGAAFGIGIGVGRYLSRKTK